VDNSVHKLFKTQSITLCIIPSTTIKRKKVDKADIVLPAGPGPFKLQGGKNGAYIKLLVM